MRFSRMQVQCHRLLGHRDPQPLDLGLGRCQRRILRRFHRAGRALRRPARPARPAWPPGTHSPPLSGPPRSARQPPAAWPARSQSTSTSRTSRSAPAAGVASCQTWPKRTSSTASRSVRHADPWLGISNRICSRTQTQHKGSMQWPSSGGELLKVAVDRGCPVGVGFLDRLGGLVGSVGGEQGGFLGRDGSCVAL
jgi:hypothetical protein